MPNWCLNDVAVYDLGVGNLVKFVDGFVESSDDERLCTPLNFYVPMPDEFKEQPGYTAHGYNWAVSHWGSKWCETDFEWFWEPLGLKMRFSSAWSPTTNGYCLLSEMFPELVFSHSWDEPGMQFMGAAVYHNGDVVWENVVEDDAYPQLENDSSEALDEWINATMITYQYVTEESMLVAQKFLQGNKL
jgi:hypothetical protein